MAAAEYLFLLPKPKPRLVLVSAAYEPMYEAVQINPNIPKLPDGSSKQLVRLSHPERLARWSNREELETNLRRLLDVCDSVEIDVSLAIAFIENKTMRIKAGHANPDVNNQ